MKKMTPTTRATLFTIGFLVTLAIAMTFVRIVIAPMIIGFTTSYLLNPLMEHLEKKGFNRTGAAASLMTGLGILTCLFIWILMPVIIVQANFLIKILPQALNTIDSNWIPSLRNFLKHNFATKSDPLSKIQFYDILAYLFHYPEQNLFESLSKSTSFLISFLATVFFTPVFFFFILKDFRKLKKHFFSIVPNDIRLPMIHLVRSIDFTLRSVLRGQLTVVSILSLCYSIGFGFAGLPAGIAIGITTGLARLVPYLDIFVGGTLCLLVVIIKSPPSSVLLGVLFVFIVIQILDGLILTPKIMGQFSGLNPFLIIISVLSFGDWFGFYGVLIAIPTAAIIRVVLETLIQTYLNSEFVLGHLYRKEEQE